MNEEKSEVENEENQLQIVETFSPLAMEVTNSSIGTRTGFGAFRKYESLSENSIRLVIESGFFLPPQQKVGEPWFWILDPEYFHFFFRKAYPGQNFRHFLNRVLVNPLYFNPFCVWALFWALAKAEHQFLFRFIPFWSHEERLTGHLVSQIIERIEEFKPHWKSLDSYQFRNSTSLFEIYYADTASGRRESVTGADLGLVVHGIFPNQKEFFKVVRFQAKKVRKSGNARINIPQAFSLMERDELGYYLF